MKYIVHRRFRGKAICGDVNIPAMTVCDCSGQFIVHNGNIICSITSENAHQFFAVNDDGMGMARGKLTQSIQKSLSKQDKQYQERWDKVWDDPVCQPYKRIEYEDFWLWNHSWFEAPIEDLRYIAKLIGTKEVS